MHIAWLSLPASCALFLAGFQAEGKEGGNSASMMAIPTRGVFGTIVPKGVGLSTTDELPLPKIFIHRDLCGMHTATNRHHIYVYL